ncbi:hypothetical protein Pfo_005320 [Paulownia fortunei]|nr:hypothetical protein Pfo_005320 [Paulownia fortunei]
MAKPVLVKSKHPISRKQNTKSLMSRNDKKTSGYEHRMLVPSEEIVCPTPRMRSTSKVELDERTVREWKILMEKLDSEGTEEADEGERDWWEKERELLHERVKSFISNMQCIQGARKFSQWKGSVIDSIGEAYLTQNVSDTISSSAFISLAAKYPHGVTRVNSPIETFIGSSTAQPNGKNGSWSSSSKIKDDKILPTVSLNGTFSKKKKTKAVSSKNILKGKPVETEDTCDNRKKTYDTSDALDWEAVRMAEVDDIAKAIQKRGMNNNLAARIKNCLNILAKDLGSIDLEWIRDVPPHKAKEYLLSIPGLGLKSVEFMCLLTLQQKAFLIDTNAGRVAVHLGWVPLQPLAEGQEFHLLKEYPKVNSVQMYLWPRLSKLDLKILYELHCQMITFGKVFVQRKTQIDACPMRAECKHPPPPPSPQIVLITLILLSAMDAVIMDAMVSSPFQVYRRKMICIQLSPLNGILKILVSMKIPRIRFDKEKLKENIQKFINEKNTPLQDGEMSKALMVLTSETASIPVPKLKNATYLRTEHQVYELPDSHGVLAGVLILLLEEKEPNDSCPYLLAIWTPENVNKDECILEEDSLWNNSAMRGIFPLNGTYFQHNEVFADDESSVVPIKLPRVSIWHLPRTTLYCGNCISTICRGMKTHEVKKFFQAGYLCVRGFNRKTREPKRLSARFHLPASKAEKPRGRKKKQGGT